MHDECAQCESLTRCRERSTVHETIVNRQDASDGSFLKELSRKSSSQVVLMCRAISVSPAMLRITVHVSLSALLVIQ